MDLATAFSTVVPAERRALVAGHEGGGAVPGLAVGPHLVERYPDQGLHAGEEERAGLLAVLGLEVECR